MAPQTSARRHARRSTRSKSSDVPARCAKTALTFALITNVITFLQMAPSGVRDDIKYMHSKDFTTFILKTLDCEFKTGWITEL